ncbi:hypothetical protein Pint_29921 [Pistacia integerrima]|uniref:Uncharacterized protein n=1 Tax=Pistacia integerrima TaxID=434235 RepID=A0ACC0X1H2_9ROSI|nr:hypothetical protein Pint_29921 [Pistacia integerrima]
MSIKLTSPTTSIRVALPFCSGINKLNFTPAGVREKKRRKQTCSFKINNAMSSLTEFQKNVQEIISTAATPMEIFNQMLVFPIINMVSAAMEEKWELNNRKAGILEPSTGRLLQDGLIFQQNFTVNSYEIGSDFRISIEALMNYLQETSLNHFKSAGILADGFGSTLEMTANDLIWVACRSHMEVYHYPSWADVVQVDGWMCRSREEQYASRVADPRLEDRQNSDAGIKVNLFLPILFVLMNKKTGKFSKASEEVMGELKPFFMHFDLPMNKDSRKLQGLDIDKADYIRTGLNPRWTDMDVNQHVSHIKLVNYVLEGVPRSVVESDELCAMTLEYRKECNMDSVLQSLSKFSSNHFINNQEIALDHSLSLECGTELVRGRTSWKK